MPEERINKGVTLVINMILLTALVVLQIVLFVYPCQQFEKESSATYSVKELRSNFYDHSRGMDEGEFARYLDAAERDANSPEAEFLKQRFVLRQKELKRDFEAWRSSTLLYLAIAVIFQLAGTWLIFRPSKSWLRYFFKVGGFLTISTLSIAFWTIFPLLVQALSIWSTISKGQGGQL